MRRVAIIGTAVVVLGLVVALFSDFSTSNHSSNAKRTDDRGSGVPLPPVEVKRLDANGSAVRIADLVRGKPTVINVWSTTCVPCQQETPAIERVHRKAGDRINIIGLNVSDTADSAAAFTRKYGATYTQLRDPRAEFLTALGSGGVLPTTYLVDGSGHIVDTEVGAVTEASLEQLLSDDFGIHLR